MPQKFPTYRMSAVIRNVAAALLWSLAACELIVFPKWAAAQTHRFAMQHASAQTFLAPTDRIEEDPYFEWAVKQKDRGGAFETAKIEYLLERIRTSPYTFIRNDVEYPASKAASHLEWKYGLAANKIKTAPDFITHLASRSIESGLQYLVKLPSGTVYSMQELLTNELRYLEDRLNAIPKNA